MTDPRDRYIHQVATGRTFAEVVKRYPKQPPAFMQRLGEEKQKAQCPA